MLEAESSFSSHYPLVRAELVHNGEVVGRQDWPRRLRAYFTGLFALRPTAEGATGSGAILFAFDRRVAAVD
ncbi:MAG: hypothetical protein ACI8PG_001461 [Planctomycetota bacterium]